MKRCYKCEQSLDESLFNKNKSHKDGLSDACRSCTKILRRDYYLRCEKQMKKTIYASRKLRDIIRQERWFNYLNTKSCKYCGNNNPLVLQFHHIGNDKKYNISQGINSYSLDNLLKEIEKCDVVCSNCHDIITAFERGNYKTKYLSQQLLDELNTIYKF